jgi:hypothetical protein
MSRPLVLSVVWWASMPIVGYVLGATFAADTSGDVAFTLVGLPQLAAAGAIVLGSLVAAGVKAWARRFSVAAAIALGPVLLWMGWEAAVRW